MKTAESLRVRRMVLCALFAALTAVCSQIAVPMPWGVPINLALFAVYMAGTMLGAFWGTVSQLVFVALAAIGVPVLAGFQGGPSAIFGKTGGYVLGYIFAALITALISKALGRKFWSLCVAMVVGCAACYVLGTIWFMTLTGADLASALGWCVLPYLPGDAIKIVLAAVLTLQLEKRASEYCLFAARVGEPFAPGAGCFLLRRRLQCGILILSTTKGPNLYEMACC